MRILRTLGRITGWALFTLTVLTVFTAAAWMIATPDGSTWRNTHMPLRVIQTGSMEPGIVPADIVITSPLRIAGHTITTPEPGDVIAFRARTTQEGDHLPVTYVHRYIGDNPDGTLITQGDANTAIDPFYVTPADVVGVEVARVPVGQWSASLNATTGINLVTPLTVIVVFFAISFGLIVAAVFSWWAEDDDENTGSVESREPVEPEPAQPELLGAGRR